MILTETKFKGVYVITPEKNVDKRGFFARIWDNKQFENRGLDVKIVQCSISFNKKRGTLRGMHYQETPYAEVKTVRCTRGSIFDVIIDLRPKSNTFKKWFGIELTEKNYKILYIPKGFAHGFLTLKDNTEIFYQMSQYYKPGYSRGVRWNDKTFRIKWPFTPKVISKTDRIYPTFEE